MTEEQKFQVFVSDYSTSVEEWRRAQQAPSSQLPELNKEQKETARKFGITEEEYGRAYLAGLYGQERLRNQGSELGRIVEEILSSLGPDYQLIAVKAEMTNLRWLLTIQTPERILKVDIPRELADDIVDSGRRQYKDALKTLVLSGLGRAQLTKKT